MPNLLCAGVGVGKHQGYDIMLDIKPTDYGLLFLTASQQCHSWTGSLCEKLPGHHRRGRRPAISGPGWAAEYSMEEQVKIVMRNLLVKNKPLTKDSPIPYLCLESKTLIPIRHHCLVLPPDFGEVRMAVLAYHRGQHIDMPHLDLLWSLAMTAGVSKVQPVHPLLHLHRQGRTIPALVRSCTHQLPGLTHDGLGVDSVFSS